MRSYPLNEARAHFSRVIDRALAGEPQRVTRHGREAVVIVSEAEWEARGGSAGTLGSLLARHARQAPPGAAGEAIGGAFPQRRPLGADID
ncbi:type II toxin-antitoxin system Phd/YefM family antitoxin [Ancylobacter terrae]|uniref:type II toxin-antitoxin system Phd/YefM family antitoxin n=1 Tax=Ancylobacter sp. sgz301288 TaxID=3342077 RepID=UPI00385D5879